MCDDLIAMFFGYARLQALDLARDELTHLAGLNIDLLSVARSFGQLIAGGAAVKRVGPQQALLCQNRERAVGRSLADAGIVFTRTDQYLLCIRMILGLDQNARNRLSRLCNPQAGIFQQGVALISMNLLRHDLCLPHLRDLINIVANASQMH